MREAIEASRIAQKSLNLCNNARTMIDIARTGGGIGIFPEPMVRGELAGGALVEIAGMPAAGAYEKSYAYSLAGNAAAGAGARSAKRRSCTSSGVHTGGRANRSRRAWGVNSDGCTACRPALAAPCSTGTWRGSNVGG